MPDLRHLIAVLIGLTVGPAASPASGQAPDDPPFVLPDGVELVRDVVYSQTADRTLRLDLFLPGSEGKMRPAVVFIHGGGWMAGDRKHFYRQAAYLASRDFVTVSIEYRLSGEAKFPAAVHDSKAAIRWIRAHAEDYGIDADRIAAAGGSAGAHLAAMLALTSDVPALEGEGDDPTGSSAVQAAVLFNPALDLPRIDHPAPGEWIGVSFADDPDLWRFASPTSHVDSRAPPTLILHGDSDSVVPYQHAADLAFLLKRAGVRSEIFTAPGAGHGFFNSPPWFEPTLERMEAFLRETLMR